MNTQEATEQGRLSFWKSMALGLKDELVKRGEQIDDLTARLAAVEQERDAALQHLAECQREQITLWHTINTQADYIKSLETDDLDAQGAPAATPNVPSYVPEPPWSTAPEWANWYTIDKDGKETWWERKPILHDSYTWWLYDWGESDSPHTRHCAVRRPPAEYRVDWQQTLAQRPQE